MLAKPLSDGTAFCFFNRLPFGKTVTVDVKQYSDDEYIEFEKKDKYDAENLWTDEKFVTDGKITVKIPAHGVAVFKLN